MNLFLKVVSWELTVEVIHVAYWQIPPTGQQFYSSHIHILSIPINVIRLGYLFKEIKQDWMTDLHVFIRLEDNTFCHLMWLKNIWR